MSNKPAWRRFLDQVQDFLTLRDLFQLAAGGGVVGVLGTALDWWSSQPTLGRFILGAVLGLAGFAVGGAIWKKLFNSNTADPVETASQSRVTEAASQVAVSNAASHLVGKYYQVIWRGEIYPQNLADALPVTHTHAQIGLDYDRPQITFTIQVFNAHPFEVSVVGQLEGVIRMRSGAGHRNPFNRPPTLIDRFRDRPYLHQGTVKIRQPLDPEEVKYIREDLPQASQAFSLEAVTIRVASSDPRREGDRSGLKLSFADIPPHQWFRWHGHLGANK